jgi:hypothetical protein
MKEKFRKLITTDKTIKVLNEIFGEKEI